MDSLVECSFSVSMESQEIQVEEEKPIRTVVAREDVIEDQN